MHPVDRYLLVKVGKGQQRLRCFPFLKKVIRFVGLDTGYEEFEGLVKMRVLTDEVYNFKSFTPCIFTKIVTLLFTQVVGCVANLLHGRKLNC